MHRHMYVSVYAEAYVRVYARYMCMRVSTDFKEESAYATAEKPSRCVWGKYRYKTLIKSVRFHFLPAFMYSNM